MTKFKNFGELLFLSQTSKTGTVSATITLGKVKKQRYKSFQSD